MSGTINLPAIFIANGFGLLILFIVLTSNRLRLREKQREAQIIRTALGIVVCTCILEPLSFWLDGRPGAGTHLAVYACNLWIFISDMLIGPLWIMMMTNHVNHRPHLTKRVSIITCAIGACLLAANFITPLVFGVDEQNRYFRGPLFLLYSSLPLLFIVGGIFIYHRARKKGGVFQFFPVMQFMVPVVIGVAIQFTFYGVSTIWPCIAIALSGVFSSLQNESSYQDQLTGLYNRYYLDHIKRKIESSEKNSSITAFLLDLNQFKKINDLYGHAEGDRALVIVSGMLRESIGEIGKVIRYAGDEFVILLNSQQDEIIQGCIRAIERRLKELNDSGKYPYELTLSIGYCKMDLKKQSVDDLLNEVDRRMYEEKRRYYEASPAHDRRNRT